MDCTEQHCCLMDPSLSLCTCLLGVSEGQCISVPTLVYISSTSTWVYTHTFYLKSYGCPELQPTFLSWGSGFYIYISIFVICHSCHTAVPASLSTFSPFIVILGDVGRHLHQFLLSCPTLNWMPNLVYWNSYFPVHHPPFSTSPHDQCSHICVSCTFPVTSYMDSVSHLVSFSSYPLLGSFLKWQSDEAVTYDWKPCKSMSFRGQTTNI